MAPLLNRNFPSVLKVDVVDGSESNVNKFFKKVHFATSRTSSTATKAYLLQKHKAEDCHYRKVFLFYFFVDSKLSLQAAFRFKIVTMRISLKTLREHSVSTELPIISLLSAFL